MNELGRDVFLDPIEAAYFLRVAVRLVVACILGGLVGMQRAEMGKSAGIRTHALVGLGAALIVVAPIFAGIPTNGMARVIQGLVEGMGFLGAGAILKLSDEHRIKGLTTAASIWMAAAIGLTVGLGLWWPALLALALTWIILNYLHEPKEQAPEIPPTDENPHEHGRHE